MLPVFSISFPHTGMYSFVQAAFLLSSAVHVCSPASNLHTCTHCIVHISAFGSFLHADAHSSNVPPRFSQSPLDICSHSPASSIHLPSRPSHLCLFSDALNQSLS